VNELDLPLSLLPLCVLIMTFFSAFASCCQIEATPESEVDMVVDDNMSQPILPNVDEPSRREKLKEIVETNKVFLHIAKDRIDDVVASFKGPLRVAAGTTIIKQGETVESTEPSLYVLMAGSVDVLVAKAADKPPGQRAATFDVSGQTFGQVALLYDCPRTATVISRASSELWHLDRESFKNGTDENGLEAIVAKHCETVEKFGLRPNSVARGFGIFDIDLTLSDPSELQYNLGCYYNMCKASTSIIATLACFEHWHGNKKVNGCAKVIPTVHKSRSNDARVFFFDDNLEWGGKESVAGICNLRDVDTGKFVEFGEGSNGFCQDRTCRFTVIQHSSEYNAVLVKANILDAMEFPSYFTDIINKYSKPGEKIITYMDVNSTILSSDSVSEKDMAVVLLGTLCEFITIKPGEAFTVEWETRSPVAV
jgi:hypothetical protein